jgi:outer membrane protein assembly factor BamB
MLILLFAVGALFWIRSLDNLSHQERNIETAKASFITLALLSIWLLFFSRLRWRVRFAVFGGVTGLVVLSAALLRIRGVTGDLAPIVEWRWSQPVSPILSAEQLSTSSPANKRVVQSANDYPQFLGPGRNATVHGQILARDWKAQPPEKLWRQAIGTAWSGFTVVGNLAVTQEQRGESEMVTAYELSSGRPVWSHADAAHYSTTIAGEGPRATPTIDRDRVYTLGATGILNCLDLVTGELVWTRNILDENASHLNEWGMSGSPLVVDNFVVVSAGGKNGRSLVAYNKSTGEFAWGGGNDHVGYSSPGLATIAGVRQILIFNAGGIAAHAADTGKLLWNYPWPKGHPHVAMPVLLPGDRVLVTSGYGTGTELLQVRRDPGESWSASRIWKSPRLKAKFTNVVYRDGYIYGLDDGIMVCLDAADGEQKWKEGRYGHGQVILTDDLLLVMAESGEFILLEPAPAGPHELSRFPALNGKTWNPPALAGEILVVRNDKEAACYRLPTVK